MEITKLPKELQFFIISKLDGSSILTARKVCHLWSEIVDILEKRFNIWSRNCFKEIPQRILVQLTGIPDLSDHDLYRTEVPWVFWKDIYLDYDRMKMIGYNQPIRTLVMSPTEFSECTALRLKDNILVSGHTDGSVVLWEDNSKYKLLSKHRSHVTAVETLNTVENLKNIALWVDGYTVVSVSRDNGIHITHPLSKSRHKIVHYSGTVNDISCYGSKFVVAANSSILNGQPIWKVTNEKTDILNTLYGHEESCISAVAAWNDEVISGDMIGNIYKWSNVYKMSSKPVFLAKFSESYAKSIYYDGFLLFCLLGDGSLCWKTENSKFNTIPHTEELTMFSATPVCIACRGRILAIGLNSGVVLLYYLEIDESWEMFSPANPQCSFQACNDSVNCLDVSDDGTSPVIVVSSTNEGISRFHWIPP